MTIPEDMSELVDVSIDRVDLVGKAANGHRFLLAKSATETPSLISPDTVRELIKEADSEPVVKDDLDVTAPLAEADDSLAAAIPGSPEWETVDAATAQKWVGILARAKNAVSILAEREAVEAVVADGEEVYNAWNLDDAIWSIDNAIGILAVFAAGEQAEVTLAAESVTKAAAGIDPADLATLEGISPLVKAGRALSASNEKALRAAAEAIQKVLASLPAPEEAPIEKETPVAEETAPETVEKDEAPAETVAAEAAEVVKSGFTLVYDAAGKPYAVVESSALQSVDAGSAAEEAAETGEEETAEEPIEEAAADTAADEVQPEDGAPAEAEEEDEKVIPGTETVQSPVEKGTGEVTVTQAPDVAALLKEYFAPLAEKVAGYDDLARDYAVLKERVEAIGREPDDRNSPLLNGATGIAGVAKRSADTDELAALAKSVEIAKEAGDPTQLANAEQAYAFASIRDRFQGK